MPDITTNTNHADQNTEEKQNNTTQDWQTIRYLYEVGLDSITGLARQFDTTYYEIKKKITQENWIKGCKKKSDHIIIAKLFKVLIMQMQNAEKSIHNKNKNEISTAKREQDAKTLGSLVRIYQKLSHMQKETNNSKIKNKSLNKMRAELEKRLKKLEKNS